MRLYVGNVPYDIHDSELAEWFTEAGFTVDAISVVRDRFTGESRGFAFVDFEDEDIAQQAIATCNGREIAGRKLVVNEARPMRERPPRSGGGGGGGGRGGYGGGGHDRGGRGGRNRY